MTTYVARARKLRDGKKCHYCSAEAETVDHIIPRAKGGGNSKANLVPSCVPCNQKKADQFPTCKCRKCTEAVESYRRRLGLRIPGEGYRAVGPNELMSLVACTKCGAVVAQRDKRLHDEYHDELVKAFSAWTNLMERAK